MSSMICMEALLEEGYDSIWLTITQQENVLYISSRLSVYSPAIL